MGRAANYVTNCVECNTTGKQCKACRRTYMAAWRKANKAKIDEYNAVYYEENKDAILERCATNYENNPEEMRRRSRDWAAANPDKVKEQSAEYYDANREKLVEKSRAYRIENSEQICAKMRAARNADLEGARARERAWERAHPESRRLSRKASGGKRRAWKRGTPTEAAATTKDIQAQLELQKYLCYYCKTPLDLATYHVDHKMPLSRGGLHAAANLACTCPTCNLRKGILTDVEFFARRILEATGAFLVRGKNAPILNRKILRPL